MDWHGLTKKKVDELRDMAKDIPGVAAVTGMSKVELVEVVAEHLGISRPRRVVKGINKKRVKAEIRELKKQRDAAIAAGDKSALRTVRKQLRMRKRKLRKAAQIA